MPGPLDAEFAAALVRQGMPPQAVLAAAREADASGASLLGWLANQSQISPPQLEQVLSSTQVPCPSCSQPLPLSEVWPRPEVSCPGCRTQLSSDGVAPRIGAVCSGRPDPGPSQFGATRAADQTVARTAAPPGEEGVGLKAGQTFLGFELLRELGRGGMGVVFHARQRTPRREVALKVLLTRGTPEALRARFRREIDALAALGGEPGIVTIYEAGEHQGLLYFAMELVQGGSLADLVRQAPVDPERALQLVAETARALHVAHEAGIVHRDIKPANVLLTPGGRPKIGDFGLVLSAEDQRITRSDAVVGTPRYLAPEQLEESTVDRRCDVYALGTVLYELLSGAHPFPQASGVAQLYTAVLSKTPTPLGQAAPDLSPEVTRVVMRALEKDPGARYPSALALAEELDRCRLARDGGGGGPVRWLIAAAVLLALVLGGLYLQRQRVAPTPPSPQASSDPALPSPEPTPTVAGEPALSADLIERQVQELRAAYDVEDPARMRAASDAAGALLERVFKDEAIRELPISHLLAGWVGLLMNEAPWGRPAVERALPNIRRSHVRHAWALELLILSTIRAATDDLNPSAQEQVHGQVATHAQNLLTHHPEFQPLGEVFYAAQVAGEVRYAAQPLNVFASPNDLRPPPRERSRDGTRYFQALCARNTDDRERQRRRGYAALAALSLTHADASRVRRNLDRAVDQDPRDPYALLLRGAYLMRAGDLASGGADLDAVEARVKDVEEGHRWHDLRQRTAMLQLERGVRRLHIALDRFRSASVAQKQAAHDSGVRELRDVIRRRPELRAHPLFWSLKAWLERAVRGGSARSLASAEEAVKRAAGTPYRPIALEARIVASNPKDPKQQARIVSDVGALLSESPRFRPDPRVFGFGNDAGAGRFDILGLDFLGAKLRRRGRDLPQAVRYFGLLTRSAYNRTAHGAFSYVRLAAAHLGRKADAAALSTLDEAILRFPQHYFPYMCRGALQLRGGKLGPARNDLAWCRRFFDRNQALVRTDDHFGRMERYLRGLERDLQAALEARKKKP